VYSAAGLQLLDRPFPADYRRERAEHYAGAKRVTQPARLSVVIFRLANEWLALPTTAFQEVAEHRRMHSLPHRRQGLVLGLVNVRGELLICASVARLLGLDSEVRGPRSEVSGPTSNPRLPTSVFGRLLVTSWNGLRLALPVDEVHGIQRLPKDELKTPPATLSKATLSYTLGIFGWRDRTVGLLEADSFFSTLNRSLAR
jgi:chemotaxis-related protein WspD